MNKLLVVYMKSRYEIYLTHLKEDPENPALKKFLEETPDGHHLLKLDEEHNRNLEKTLNALEKSGIKYDAHYRADLCEELIKHYDQVMTIGGDGTFLEAAGHIKDKTPIIAVNTAVYFDEALGKRRGSEGFYAAINPFNFDKIFPLFIAGELKATALNRLLLEYESQKVEHLVMNEVSVGPEDPHSTVRYTIRAKDFEEDQFSSGLIIATPQEAWAMSYPGGTVLPIEEKSFQAVTRANYNSRYDMELGIYKTDGIIIRHPNSIEVESKSRTATVAVDGKHKQFPFTFGTKIKVSMSDFPLNVIGFDNEQRLMYCSNLRKPIVRKIS